MWSMLLSIFDRAESGMNLTPTERAIVRGVRFFLTNAAPLFSLPVIGTTLLAVGQFFGNWISGQPAHFPNIPWGLEGLALLVAVVQTAWEMLRKYNSAQVDSTKQPSALRQGLEAVQLVADAELPKILEAIGKRAGLSPTDMTHVQDVAGQITQAVPITELARKAPSF